MQDFKTYSYKLTVNDLQKIIDDGLEVVAIINGEYYDIVKEKTEKVDSERGKHGRENHD